MKKLMMMVAGAVALGFAAQAAEITVPIDGIDYSLDTGNHTASVTLNSTAPRNVVIPETVPYNREDYTVTAIGPGAFYFADGIRTVRLPETARYTADRILVESGLAADETFVTAGTHKLRDHAEVIEQ